jgi:hypothetical protein
VLEIKNTGLAYNQEALSTKISKGTAGVFSRYALTFSTYP